MNKQLEEAIRHIKTRADAWAVKEVTEALQSISERLDKALSQEPCDNAISRDELLKAIDTWDKFGVDDTNSLFRLDNLSLPHYVPYIHYDDVIKCIKGMPSVTQRSVKWIPFSERLPKPFEYCLITTTDGEVIYHYDDGHYSKYKAWMPLPIPYKAESEDKE